MKKKQIAIVHTALATIDIMKKLINQSIPGAEIINFLDDSILPMLMEDEDSLTYAFEKILTYARFAEKQGAAIFFNACSSIGEFKDYAKGKINIPVVRVDDAVSDMAAKEHGPIAVLATLKTTLAPSCRLLEKKCKTGTVIHPFLAEGAFDALKSGDREKHNALIAKTVNEALKEHGVIYLAQASMADAIDKTSFPLDKKLLTSTVPAVEALGVLYRSIM